MYLGELNIPIERIKGIGEKISLDMNNLGIYKIKDILSYFPARYENRMDIVSIKDSLKDSLKSGTVNTVATVVDYTYIGYGSKKTLKIIISDNTGYLNLICFGRNFLESKLVKNTKIYIFSSSVCYKFSELQTSSFEYEEYIDSETPKNFGMLLPVYPLGGKITQHILRKFINNAIILYGGNLSNEIPTSICNKLNLLTKVQSIKNIHFPSNNSSLLQAINTLKFEELFHLQMINARKILTNNVSHKNPRNLPTKLLNKVISTLPFNLTTDQIEVISQIILDLNSNMIMNRLVQGDVGCGKTLVALLSSLPVIEGGGQVALMAPTELLAKQHSEKAYELLHQHGIATAFISGNIKSAQRKLLLEQLKQGSIDIIIGTHALFTEDVIYKSLELVIVDEQHRFGVKQRLALINKGNFPDLLLMTATPIPRTLTISLFGDLKVSTIKKMPIGRKTIETHLVKVGNEEKLYNFIFGELNKGHQCYFVYPLIDQSDKLELKDAESMLKNLEEVFKGFNLGIIHSKIPEEQKEETMHHFNNGQIDILVATSVVEVGVDNPNATIMVIEHAERFGLSALHQLRGRVGRSNLQSYCFLSYSNILSDDGKKRILTMKTISDGFKISEEDLKLRGPGDIAGVKQSGFMKLKIASLIDDYQLLVKAREIAIELCTNDPGLLQPENHILRDLYSIAPPFSDEFISQG